MASIVWHRSKEPRILASARPRFRPSLSERELETLCEPMPRECGDAAQCGRPDRRADRRAG